ncbi:MAG: HAD-IA family hydrolase [Eubacteriales bacterium]
MMQVVLFDLDDTLISEYEYIQSGFTHIAALLEERLQDQKEAIYEKMLELFQADSSNLFNRIFEAYDATYEMSDIHYLVEEYRGHKPSIHFYEDVMPTIHQLQERGMQLGIITDGYAIAQRLKLKAVGAEDFFEHIIVTDELGREFWKPHGKSFELMQEYFGVDWNEMVYVGDNPKKDFHISSVYPIQTVRIIRDKSVYAQDAYLDGIEPTKIIEDLRELVEMNYFCRR